MTNEIAMLIALMCPQTDMTKKVQCLGTIRACYQNPKVVVKKGNHKVFKCAKVFAEKNKKRKR